MSRIRTVKPELFKHEDLFDAEIASKLPLRLAFIGLLTCCDREGRFKWQPQRLKLDILPYDNIDVAEVLAALAKYDFIKKYEHHGKWYGYIPSWSKHQQINNREIASDIIAPSDAISIKEQQSELKIEATNAINTKESQVAKQSQHYTKISKENIAVVLATTQQQNKLSDDLAQTIFNHWKIIMKHPDAKLDSNRKMLIDRALGFGYNVQQLCNAITGCSMTPHNIGDNERGQRYDGLHIILRDADQIDRFIHHYRNPPQLIYNISKATQQNLYTMQSWINKKIQEKDDE
jgi:hypothetical protein